MRSLRLSRFSGLLQTGRYQSHSVRHIRSSTHLLTQKILISDPIEQSCVDILNKAGYEVTRLDKAPSSAKLIEMIPSYDALIVRSGTQVTKEVINAGKNLKIIGRAGTGVDNIDVYAASRAGKIVMNTPAGNSASAAELTLSLIMALSRNIPNANNSLKSGKWDRKKFMGTELAGKTIGIIGLGQIGRRVAVACQALGMRTIGYDPILSKEKAAESKIELVNLNELYPQSDYISLHTPLTDETRNLFNEATFAKCKDGVRIVNCARGGIIDELALVKAIENGKVSGAALDVFDPEPPLFDKLKPVLSHPAIICTPHLGASTEEAQEKVAKEIATQIVKAFEGDGLVGTVNSPIYSKEPKVTGLYGYVELAERIGMLQAQLLKGNLKKITLTTKGAFLKPHADTIKIAALKGLLSIMTDAPVNYISASIIAEEFGLKIDTTHDSSVSSNESGLDIVLETDTGERKIGGIVFAGGDRIRITNVDDYPMEVVPEGNALFFNNNDKPGVIASVASVLGKNGINISNWWLGRKGVGGQAAAVVGVDEKLTPEVLAEIEKLPNMLNVSATWLPKFPQFERTKGLSNKPQVKPSSPNFGSGPTAKFPGYDLAKLPTRSLGRSHRSSLGKKMLKDALDKSRSLLQIPDDYLIGIVPGSDTGAFEMAMWSLLGPRPVDVCQWESFGKGWETDIKQELKLKTRTFTAPYGELPDLKQTDPAHDIVFTYNGTTSGVRVPNCNWISSKRQGLTLCDATSAVFAMEMDWPKLDVTTYSWQKALGGEAAHGMIILSPRAVERLKTYVPPWPLPKVFRLTKDKKVQEDIFTGNVINTVSMLCVEDLLAALNWAEGVGGLKGMIKRSQENLKVLEDFQKKNKWLNFLVRDPEIRSSTSVCLTLDLPKEKVSQFTKLLQEEGVAYDIGSYRSAPPGLRIWCGSTIEKDDVEALTHWLRWAYQEVTK